MAESKLGNGRNFLGKQIGTLKGERVREKENDGKGILE
jgi:hypothetical protein